MIFTVAVWIRSIRGQFWRRGSPTGSLSHWAARGSGHHHQLPAGTGREIYNLLPAQLWQARLLQGKTGIFIFNTNNMTSDVFFLFSLHWHQRLQRAGKRPHTPSLYPSVSHLWSDHRLAAGASPPGTERRSQDQTTCMWTRTAIRKSPSEDGTQRDLQKRVT